MTGSRMSNSILIVTAGRNSFDVIKGAVRSGFSPVLYAESMAAAKQLTARENIDIIIVNTPLKDEFGTESLLDIVAQKPVSAMEIIKGDVYEQVSHKVNGSGIFVVTRPITSRGLYESVRLLTTMHDKLSELAAENRKLKRRLDELGIVTRAKCLLIEKKGFTEEEAHHYLEKEAMDTSLTKKEVAQQIIRDLEEETAGADI
ncbi:MAG: ANTAR domain-containing protein [Firmicutes bacterium]|nr:ANTAR domain-containing protein [Bacillota bacterium]